LTITEKSPSTVFRKPSKSKIGMSVSLANQTVNDLHFLLHNKETPLANATMFKSMKTE